MKKYTFLAVACSAVLASAVIVSCHKKTTPVAEDTGYTTDQALTEKTYNDVQTIADQASTVTSGSSLNYRTSGITMSGCATVTKTTGTITIDFGTTDCLCKDGRLRRGQIIVTYSGNYSDSGSVHTITFNNYFVDENQVLGTKTVTNMGHNSLGQPYFNVVISGSVIRTTGGTVSVAWTRVRTWTAGYSTPTDFTDDVYSISGSGTMTRANGTVVSMNIPTSTPLIVAYSCEWIEAGTITYTLPGGATRTLNYGNTPNCDDEATLTLPSGVTYNIVLP